MNKDLSTEDKNIVFIGFMGVGKTTIGKAVARKLNREFIDVDHEIEKEYEMAVADIFKQYGESTFRKKEKELVLSLAKQDKKVLSLGGGSFLQDEIREVCLDNCLVIYLSMSFTCWKERIPLLMPSRPVLHGKSEKEIYQLFMDRKQIYADNHMEIVTDHKDSDEVAEHIVHEILNK